MNTGVVMQFHVDAVQKKLINQLLKLYFTRYFSAVTNYPTYQEIYFYRSQKLKPTIGPEPIKCHRHVERNIHCWTVPLFSWLTY
jgi:hypothetical protein